MEKAILSLSGLGPEHRGHIVVHGFYLPGPWLLREALAVEEFVNGSEVQSLHAVQSKLRCGILEQPTHDHDDLAPVPHS